MVDCGKKSLAEAVRDVKDANQTITFIGVCAGPLVMAIDGLTLKGEGTAITDGSPGSAFFPRLRSRGIERASARPRRSLGEGGRRRLRVADIPYTSELRVQTDRSKQPR